MKPTTSSTLISPPCRATALNLRQLYLPSEHKLCGRVLSLRSCPEKRRMRISVQNTSRARADNSTPYFLNLTVTAGCPHADSRDDQGENRSSEIRPQSSHRSKWNCRYHEVPIQNRSSTALTKASDASTGRFGWWEKNFLAPFMIHSLLLSPMRTASGSHRVA